MGNSTHCKIVTPENFILKLCTRDYVSEMTLHANFGFKIGTVGASPQIGEILPLCDFFRLSCSVLSCPIPFFLDPAPWSNRLTDFHALWLKRRVST